jgi:poly-gamma-glutamate capsule biosynthesis protein CapA/YwtB (metallophosphatase superfamily)
VAGFRVPSTFPISGVTRFRSLRSDDYWKGKGIHYRMHPDNAAHIDCCVLANNHVLDYGDAGLLETVL